MIQENIPGGSQAKAVAPREGYRRINRFRSLKGSGKGLAHILGGNVGAQAIGFLTLPLLSRIFSPDEYGFFSLVLAIVGVIAPMATLRFETAAMLASEIVQVRAAAWNAILSSVFFASCSAVVLQILVLANVADLNSYPSVPYWVALLVLLNALFITLTQLSLRKQQYALVAQRTLLRSVATAVPQLGLGFLGAGGGGLLVGTAIGSSAGILTMVARVREFLTFPGGRHLRDTWRTYWRFPAVFTPSTLLNALGAQIPLIFVAAHFGLAVGGQLGMAERIVGLPVTVIGYAVSQVLQAEVAKLLRERKPELKKIYLRFSLGLGGIALVAGLSLGLLGPWLIPFVLGSEWATAGQVVQILAFTSAVRLVATSLSNMLVLTQHSLANFLLDVLRVTSMLAAVVLVLAFDFGLVASLWTLYSALTMTYIVTWVTGLAVSGRYDKSIGPSSPGEEVA